MRVCTTGDYHVTYGYTFLTVLLCTIVNILQPGVTYLYPLKMSENL